MDLEMTGLDPATDVIVEIASLVTDDDLNIVAEGPDLVIHQPDAVLAAMDPVVVTMHTESGLLEAIRGSRATSPHRAIVWELHRYRSPIFGQVSAGNRELSALSQRGCVEREGTCQTLVPRNHDCSPHQNRCTPGTQ
jgi:hypothetical protein